MIEGSNVDEALIEISFFFMWTIFKGFVLTLLQYCFCFKLVFLGGKGEQGMWHLSSPTRDQSHTLCIERYSLNH